MDLGKMIIWLVLKLGINDRVMISWRSLLSFRRFFFKIIFLHGEILEFPSSFFCLKILFNVNGKAIVWYTKKKATKKIWLLQDWQLKSIFTHLL
jgi:hypothetical protein